MKLHQMMSHMKRSQEPLKIRVQDMKKLIEYHEEIADYLDQTKLSNFFGTYYPNFKGGVYIKLNRWQRAIVQTYKRPVSYDELLHVHTWWDRFSELPKREYPRLDQHDPFLAAQGFLEQEQLLETIGSIKTGVKNPLTRQHDTLVVVGTATGYEEQLASIAVPHDTMAVNGAGVKVDCDFFYSIHGSYLRKWKSSCLNPNVKTICEWWIPGVDSGYGIFNEELKALNQFHYSGNMAVLTGLIMGYPRIVMVGCPLSPVATSENLLLHEGKILELDTWEKTLLPRMSQIQDHFVKGMQLFPESKERIRSISGGFTEQYFGRGWDD